MNSQGSKINYNDMCKTLVLCLCVLVSTLAWSRIFVQWSEAQFPEASALGVSDIVLSQARNDLAVSVAAARKKGYQVYLEATLKQAAVSARACARTGCAGIILNVLDSQGPQIQKTLESLRSAFPQTRFIVLNPHGKLPQMRGSLVIQRDSVLEVSSPTMQPWIDTNLAFLKVDRLSRQQQTPLYTFSWADQEPRRRLTADDYSLAVAEAGSFHADLLLQVGKDLQQDLLKGDSDAWTLWNQVRSILKFTHDSTSEELRPAANVAVVSDQFDPGDEVLNLLSRHNIPFRLFLSEDFKKADLKGFDVVVVLEKIDAETSEQTNRLAAGGLTIVAVDAHGKYPWQSGQSVQLNEHTTAYSVGQGKVLELAEPVTDPETFAQDIRRLLGKRNSLLSLWNGLTTIAVPYENRDGALSTLELVNYSGDPLRLQVQVKGLFAALRYETPEHGCCSTLDPIQHDGSTEFVIPELRITGRVRFEP